MAENGALATTVADLAVAHAVLAGEEPAPPAGAGPAAADRASPPGRRCRGCAPTPPARAAVDAVVAAARPRPGTPSCAGTRRSPPAPPLGALARWMAGAEDDAEHLGLDRRGAAAAQPHPRPARARWSAGPGWSGRAPRSAFRERMVGFFADVDVLLTPVTTGPPLAARPWHERSFLANITANARWAPWAAAWNLAGLPALVLPGRHPAARGCPLAVQFVGPPGAETRLLWLAGELERRQPWRRYAPVFDPTAATGRRARLSARRSAARRPARVTRRDTRGTPGDGNSCPGIRGLGPSE